MSETTTPSSADPVRIGIVSISDRASTGVYEDKGLPALQDWLTRALRNPITFEPRLIPDEQARISATLIELVHAGCSLVLTTGGTGPALRDVTPEATLAVAHKEMPGFGEQMRQISLAFVPTAILSRQVAVIRSQSLIINLPGQPKAIAETLEGLKNADGTQRINGIFAAVPYCIDLIGGPYLETHDDVCKAFRPKSAVRPPANPFQRPAMKITKDTIVTLTFRAVDAKGKVLEDGKEPRAYLHGGYGNTLPGVEMALEGQEKGFKTTVKLLPALAFGERDESLVTSIPKKDFPPGVKVGGQLEGSDADGNRQIFTVTKIKGDTVMLDGNHPLAGQDLTFTLNVIDVKAASAEEIAHGHAHGAHGHHH